MLKSLSWPQDQDSGPLHVSSASAQEKHLGEVQYSPVTHSVCCPDKTSTACKLFHPKPGYLATICEKIKPEFFLLWQSEVVRNNYLEFSIYILVEGKYCDGRNMQRGLLPSRSYTRMAAVISHHNTPKPARALAVDEQLPKIHRRIKELGMSKPCSSLFSGLLD